MKPIVRISLLVMVCVFILSAPMMVMSQPPRGENVDSTAKRTPPAAKEGEGGEGGYSLLKLVHTIAEKTDAAFVYEPPQLEGRMAFVAGDIEEPETKYEWFQLLGDLLYTMMFTYIRISDERPLYRILPVQEAGMQAAPAVTDPEDLPADAYFGCLIVYFDRADVNAAQRALLNLATRPGGIVQPIPGSNALLIQDTRTQLKRMYQAAHLFDTRPRRFHGNGDDE